MTPIFVATHNLLTFRNRLSGRKTTSLMVTSLILLSLLGPALPLPAQAGALGAMQPFARLSRLSEAITIEAAERGKPWLYFQDGRDLEADYDDPFGLQRRFVSDQMEAASLASADFDEDGTPDLVSAYAGTSGGAITIHRGNPDSVYPESAEAHKRKAEGAFSEAPFLSPAKIFDLDSAPDFVQAADFDGDGHMDIVTAARGGNALNFMLGNGQGSLVKTEAVIMPGAITALASGDINRADAITDLIVGIETAQGAKALVLEGAQGAMKAEPESFDLPYSAKAMAVGFLDNDNEADLAIAAGNELVIVQGRDRMLTLDEAARANVEQARIAQRSFALNLVALAVGDFAGDEATEVAVLSEDGALYLAREDNESRQSALEVERAASDLNLNGAILVKARVAAMPHDSLVITGGNDKQLRVWLNEQDRQRRGSVSVASLGKTNTISFSARSEPVAVLPMRLNPDGINDLAILSKGQVAPSFVISSVATTVTVTSTADSGPGSLRQAINDANGDGLFAVAVGTPSEIRFAIGSGSQTITLTSGPLPPISDTVTIRGDTQPGYNGTPIITIDGVSIGGANGLDLISTSSSSATNSVVRGLVVRRVGGIGIRVAVTNTIIEGNFIGLNSNGSSTNGNNVGVSIISSNALVGGTASGATNFITGNQSNGVQFSGGSSVDNRVQNNVIGLNAFNAIIGNGQHGVSLSNGAARITVGGSVVGTANDIVGNNLDGVFVSSSNSNNVLRNDLVSNRRNAISLLSSANNLVGGSNDIVRNNIWRSGSNGVEINGSTATGNRVQRNWIGVRFDNGNPINDVSNSLSGVLITNSASGNTIGGFDSGTFNYIAYNGGDGVAVASGRQNLINGNNIFANGDLAVDLGNDGPTDNDPGDVDSGANDKLNFPVVTSAVITTAAAASELQPAAIFRVTFTIEFTSQRNLACNIDIWYAAQCCRAPSGRDQLCSFPRRLVADKPITTDNNGNYRETITLDVDLPAPSGFVSAQSTTPSVGSSEYSPCSPLTQAAACSYTLNPTASDTIPASGGSRSFNVQTASNCQWTATPSQPWIQITSGASGTGNGTVNYTVTANPDGASRSGNITVNGQTYAVNQAGASCNLTLSSTSRQFDAAGGSNSFNVTAPNGCNWTAAANQSWIRITSPAGGAGSGSQSVNYTVDPNPNGTARSGNITVGNQTHAISQGAAACNFAISPDSRSFDSGGGAGSFDVTVPTGCNWTATRSASATWIVLNNSAGNGNGTVTYTVQANPDATTRTGTITVSGRTHTITQGGVGCTINITPADRSFGAGSSAGNTISVTAPNGCPWTAAASQTWVQITSGASGNGNGTVTYSVQSNPNASPRSATITIGDKTHTINQAAVGCTFSLSATSRSFIANGGSSTVNLTTPNGCQWSASSNRDWIRITSAASGNGSATISFTVDPNTEAARSGTITIADRTLTITQSGRPTVTNVTRSGKKLFVEGSGFVEGAKIWLNGEQQKTGFDSSTFLTGKKAGKKVVSGQNRVKVVHPDGTESNEFIFNF